MPKTFVYSVRNYGSKKAPDEFNDGDAAVTNVTTKMLTRSVFKPGQDVYECLSPWHSGVTKRLTCGSRGSGVKGRKMDAAGKSYHHLSLVTRFYLGLRMSRMRSSASAPREIHADTWPSPRDEEQQLSSLKQPALDLPVSVTMQSYPTIVAESVLPDHPSGSGETTLLGLSGSPISVDSIRQGKSSPTSTVEKPVKTIKSQHPCPAPSPENLQPVDPHATATSEKGITSQPRDVTVKIIVNGRGDHCRDWQQLERMNLEGNYGKVHSFTSNAPYSALEAIGACVMPKDQKYSNAAAVHDLNKSVTTKGTVSDTHDMPKDQKCNDAAKFTSLNENSLKMANSASLGLALKRSSDGTGKTRYPSRCDNEEDVCATPSSKDLGTYGGMSHAGSIDIVIGETSESETNLLSGMLSPTPVHSKARHGRSDLCSNVMTNGTRYSPLPEAQDLDGRPRLSGPSQGLNVLPRHSSTNLTMSDGKQYHNIPQESVLYPGSGHFIFTAGSNVMQAGDPNPWVWCLPVAGVAQGVCPLPNSINMAIPPDTAGSAIHPCAQIRVTEGEGKTRKEIASNRRDLDELFAQYGSVKKVKAATPKNMNLDQASGRHKSGAEHSSGRRPGQELAPSTDLAHPSTSGEYGDKNNTSFILKTTSYVESGRRRDIPEDHHRQQQQNHHYLHHNIAKNGSNGSMNNKSSSSNIRNPSDKTLYLVGTGSAAPPKLKTSSLPQHGDKSSECSGSSSPGTNQKVIRVATFGNNIPVFLTACEVPSRHQDGVREKTHLNSNIPPVRSRQPPNSNPTQNPSELEPAGARFTSKSFSRAFEERDRNDCGLDSKPSLVNQGNLEMFKPLNLTSDAYLSLFSYSCSSSLSSSSSSLSSSSSSSSSSSTSSSFSSSTSNPHSLHRHGTKLARFSQILESEAFLAKGYGTVQTDRSSSVVASHAFQPQAFIMPFPESPDIFVTPFGPTSQTFVTPHGPASQTFVTSHGPAPQTFATSHGPASHTFVTSHGPASQTFVTSHGPASQTFVTSHGPASQTFATSQGPVSQTFIKSPGSVSQTFITPHAPASETLITPFRCPGTKPFVTSFGDVSHSFVTPLPEPFSSSQAAYVPHTFDTYPSQVSRAFVAMPSSKRSRDFNTAATYASPQTINIDKPITPAQQPSATPIAQITQPYIHLPVSISQSSLKPRDLQSGEGFYGQPLSNTPHSLPRQPAASSGYPGPGASMFNPLQVTPGQAVVFLSPSLSFSTPTATPTITQSRMGLPSLRDDGSSRQLPLHLEAVAPPSSHLYLAEGFHRDERAARPSIFSSSARDNSHKYSSSSSSSSSSSLKSNRSEGRIGYQLASPAIYDQGPWYVPKSQARVSMHGAPVTANLPGLVSTSLAITTAAESYRFEPTSLFISKPAHAAASLQNSETSDSIDVSSLPLTVHDVTSTPGRVVQVTSAPDAVIVLQKPRQFATPALDLLTSVAKSPPATAVTGGPARKTLHGYSRGDTDGAESSVKISPTHWSNPSLRSRDHGRLASDVSPPAASNANPELAGNVWTLLSPSPHSGFTPQNHAVAQTRASHRRSRNVRGYPLNAIHSCTESLGRPLALETLGMSVRSDQVDFSVETLSPTQFTTDPDTSVYKDSMKRPSARGHCHGAFDFSAGSIQAPLPLNREVMGDESSGSKPDNTLHLWSLAGGIISGDGSAPSQDGVVGLSICPVSNKPNSQYKEFVICNGFGCENSSKLSTPVASANVSGITTTYITTTTTATTSTITTAVFIPAVSGSNSNYSSKNNSKSNNKTSSSSRGAGPLATKPGRVENQCPVCYRLFSRSWLLKGHIRTHTGERPYQCSHPSCHKAFADRSNLRSHMLTHTVTAPGFACPRCGRTFSQKRYLHKHATEVCKIATTVGDG